RRRKRVWVQTQQFDVSFIGFVDHPRVDKDERYRMGKDIARRGNLLNLFDKHPREFPLESTDQSL
ncbi:hypothetical protein, partial [Sinorhizobium meliloti]|uniref:hypothetical protein n=1 Tax=Rhizobium meliloti TaxID=382 RepID=UPI0013E3237C